MFFHFNLYIYGKYIVIPMKMRESQIQFPNVHKGNGTIAQLSGKHHTHAHTHISKNSWRNFPWSAGAQHLSLLCIPHARHSSKVTTNGCLSSGSRSLPFPKTFDSRSLSPRHRGAAPSTTTLHSAPTTRRVTRSPQASFSLRCAKTLSFAPALSSHTLFHSKIQFASRDWTSYTPQDNAPSWGYFLSEAHLGLSVSGRDVDVDGERRGEECKAARGEIERCARARALRAARAPPSADNCNCQDVRRGGAACIDQQRAALWNF